MNDLGETIHRNIEIVLWAILCFAMVCLAVSLFRSRQPAEHRLRGWMLLMCVGLLVAAVGRLGHWFLVNNLGCITVICSAVLTWRVRRRDAPAALADPEER